MAQQYSTKQLSYDEFVNKFKPKKTTDDCFTPPEIYDAIVQWVQERYGVEPETIVRPFWPGGDYFSVDYPDGCTVVDNPPFSILAEICRFYMREGVPFFLFAPALTTLSARELATSINHIITDCTITYDNGANVKTSFVTSFGLPVIYQTAPELTRRVNAVNRELEQRVRKQLPKYTYPDHVLTAAMGQRYAKYGIDFAVRSDECEYAPALDAQKPYGKGIFGGGLLLNDAKASERAAAERAAAERAAAERAAATEWHLSERERGIISRIGKPKPEQLELL